MFRFAKNATAAIALTGLVISQPAFATRSSEALPAPGAQVSVPMARVGTPIGRSQDLAGVPAVGIVIGLIVVIGGLVIILDDNKNHNKSPG